MTPTDWDTMTPKERDYFILMEMFDGQFDGHNLKGWTAEKLGSWLPQFTARIDLAMEAEEKIMQMGESMMIEYTTNLMRCVGNGRLVFHLIHASAADRCKAMWMTINGKEEGK